MSGRVFSHKMNIGDIRTVTAAGAITMGNEGALVVKKTVGAASAVALQPDAIAGDFIFIKDGKGDAGTNAITITPGNSKLIDGAATYVISENYGAALLYFDGTGWNTVSTFKETANESSGTFTTLTATTANSTTANITTANVGTQNTSGITSWSDVATVNAAGSVIGNAAALTNAVSIVAGADDTKGVILPVAAAGKLMLVYQTAATAGLKIYPQVNSTINTGTANSAIVIEGKSLALFVGTSATNWASIFTVNA